MFPSELFDTMATVHAECRTAHFISVEQTVIVDKAVTPPTVCDGT